MEEIKVKFETLTPLWTGDAWGECNELKLTGIIGSLRWWFEALVRGMGYKVPRNSKPVEIKNPQDIFNIPKKTDPVSYLFGTTGWKSRFSVGIIENNLTQPYDGKIIVEIRGRWYYDPGLMGDVTLSFKYKDYKMVTGKEKVGSLTAFFPSIIKLLLYLVSEYGMLGAKTSMGYGVVNCRIDDNDISVTEKDWKNFEKYLSFFEKSNSKDEGLPNLKNMFFVTFTEEKNLEEVVKAVKGTLQYNGDLNKIVNNCKDEGWCITSPFLRKEIRNKIRNEFNGNQRIRHFLMGSASEMKYSSIQVSHIYKTSPGKIEFRIYGWIPRKSKIIGDVSKKVTGLLSDLFKSNFGLKEDEWKLKPDINNICWDGSKLNLVDSKIKDLFIP